MTPREIVRALIGALQAGDFAAAETFLSDDFQFSGSVPEPITGGAWIRLTARLKAACPDLKYHYQLERADHNPVRIACRFTGTHTTDLNMTRPAIGIVPATGKSFSMEVEHGRVLVRDDKVVSWKMRPDNGAGLVAILDQLGFSLATGSPQTEGQPV